jgi:hypothetical protein
MMSFIAILESIPPALYGVMIGSLLTVIGVTLTNISNTKRLRIQHEHERNLENKARDLNLRRDVYMQAMEAISAGLVAVSRFSELNASSDELMHSYTDLSPKIGKVTIVGKNETIKAVATFNLELTGAFLRLTATREKIKAVVQRIEFLDKEIQATQQQLDNLADSTEEDIEKNMKKTKDQIQKEYNATNKRLENLKAEYDSFENQFMSMQIDLVQECTSEVAKLDELLVPMIGLMRSELELPFNEKYYAKILKDGHEKQKEYLAEFFKDFQKDST